jgi:hypothetical protein
MMDGIKSGAAPKAFTTYMEPGVTRRLPDGKYAFLRTGRTPTR